MQKEPQQQPEEHQLRWAGLSAHPETCVRPCLAWDRLPTKSSWCGGGWTAAPAWARGAARRAAPPCITPCPSPVSFCLCSAFALYTCLVPSCPQSKLGHLRFSVSEEGEKEEEVVVATGARGTGTWGTPSSSFFFRVKGDLKGSDPPRFIPKTCNLHIAWPITFSVYSVIGTDA